MREGPASRPSLPDAQLLAKLERAFARLAGADACIDAAELKAALGLRSDYLAKRVLARFDRDGDGMIRRDEFLEGVRRLVFGTERDKLLFAFALHDHEGHGAIGYQELHRMIAMSLAEADVEAHPSQSSEGLARALMSVADRDHDGLISFAEFEAVLAHRPEIVRRMTRTEAVWIAPSEDILALIDAPPSRAARALRYARYVSNRLLPLTFLGLWAAANALVFALALGSDDGANPFALVGRACGACMTLNGALILIPVMRRLLTRVRATWLRRVIPVDEAIAFHRLAGHSLFAFAIAHAMAFTAAHAIGHPDAVPGAFLFNTVVGATGAALLVVFGVMWAFALSPVRRTHRFELFYFTHLLYLAWFALAIAHAPSIVPWVAAPLGAYLVERWMRSRRRGERVLAVGAHALRSGVTRLDLERPAGFTFRAGDYVFLRVPSIAKHEWHPFTISSAPENDALSVHIRSLGNWTSALRRRVEADEAAGEVEPLAVYVDGPYGSPTANLYDAEFAVFIGAGIGVTPFASVLESLVLRAGARRPAKLKRVHFFWLNRSQYSFEWFGELLTELERIDASALLDVHLCMTDGRSDATSVGLEIAREVAHAAGGRDVVTGLRAMTHMGHPDWDAALGAIARAHAPAAVEVFFCGPPGLGATVRRACARVGMPFRREDF